MTDPFRVQQFDGVYNALHAGGFSRVDGASKSDVLRALEDALEIARRKPLLVAAEPDAYHAVVLELQREVDVEHGICFAEIAHHVKDEQ